MIMAEDRFEMEMILRELKTPESSILKLNVNKFQIMSNRKDMMEVKKVEEIKVSESIKYLGMEL
jgi:hypothetical protein